MNYFHIYEQLVERGRNRDRSTLEYVEVHHIVPRCMGGNDEPDNLVALTLEEHFVAHQLLAKMFPHVDALIYAAHMMGNRNNKQYAWLRRQFVEREKINKKGSVRTEESKRKQSETMKAKFAAGAKHPRSGTTIGAEHRRQISEANKGKTVPVEKRCSLEGFVARYGEEEGTRLYQETGKKKDSKSLESFIARFGEEEGTMKYEEWTTYLKTRIAPMKGKKHSEEVKAAMRKPKPVVACPHCGKEGGVGIMKRWHFDNCKEKGLLGVLFVEDDSQKGA